MSVVILLRRAQSRPGHSDEHEVLGPCERGALVAGLQLAADMGTDAIAVAAGPARREDRVLAMALRAGVHRAIRIVADGVDDLDYLGVAETLAAAVRTLGANLVTCGDRSVDERGGAVGPAVAEVLGYAHLTGISAVALDRDRIVCERVGDTQRDRVAVRAPAVLCVLAPPVTDTEHTPVPSQPRARTRAPAIESLDGEALALDLRRLAPRKRTGGRLRPVRGARAASLVSASDLVQRLEAEALVQRRGRSRGRP